MTRNRMIIAGLVVVMVVAAAVLFWPTSDSTTATAPADQPPSPAPATQSYNPDAGDAGENENAPAETQEAIWGPVVDNFGRQFTNTTGGAQKWRQRLIGNPKQPYVTDEVAKQLATVDVRNVPDGHFSGHELVKSGEYEIGVKVDYREGWSQILWLITDGSTWQIYAYDRWDD